MRARMPYVHYSLIYHRMPSEREIPFYLSIIRPSAAAYEPTLIVTRPLIRACTIRVDTNLYTVWVI